MIHEEETKSAEEGSVAPEYPLKRVASERVNYVAGGFKGWDIVYVNDAGIAKSLESQKVQSYLSGV